MIEGDFIPFNEHIEIMNNAGIIFDEVLIPFKFFLWLKENKYRLIEETASLNVYITNENILDIEEIR